MKTEFSLKTRREFLRSSLLGGALTWTVPTFLAHTFDCLQAQAADSAVQTPTGADSNILVVLQMAGGNDGLNTVVPFSNDHYAEARARLRIPAKEVLRINDQLGFHPALEGFKSLYDEGHLSIIQGVGYPNPNRSHFRSTEIWQTASDSDKSASYGWLGRYFDSCCKGADPTVGVSIGNELPQSFLSPHPTGVAFSRPEQYRCINGNKNNATEEMFRELNSPDDMPAMAGGVDTNTGGSIGMIAGSKKHEGGSTLDFLQRTALDAQMSSEKIREIARKFQSTVPYPATPLAN